MPRYSMVAEEAGDLDFQIAEMPAEIVLDAEVKMDHNTSESTPTIIG
jgi:hypothetical protein